LWGPQKARAPAAAVTAVTIKTHPARKSQTKKGNNIGQRAFLNEFLHVTNMHTFIAYRA
jgi:hypothetical protein